MGIVKDTTCSIIWPPPHASLVFSLCILNTITNFISLQMEAIRLQLLVTQYRSLGQEKPYELSKV
jgi:hypothetical protein